MMDEQPSFLMVPVDAWMSLTDERRDEIRALPADVALGEPVEVGDGTLLWDDHRLTVADIVAVLDALGVVS